MRCILRKLAGFAMFCLAACAPPKLPAQTGPPAAPANPLVAMPNAALPATANAASAKQLPAAKALYGSMLLALESHQSIAARVRHRIDMFDHQLVGSGIYLQQSLSQGQSRSPERLLRFELKIPVDEQVTSLQQISDGNTLWMHQDLLDKTSLSKIDLTRLRLSLANQTPPAKNPLTAWIALGGLPKLMQNLAVWYRFTSVEEGRLDRFPVWVMRGQLYEYHLAGLLPGQKDKILAGQPPDLNKLAKQIPDRVVLMIGREDLFPYRIEYWRLFPGEKKPLSLKKAPPVDRLVLAMELFEVQLDVPLAPGQFIYNPGDRPVLDQTAGFLQSLGLKDVVEAKTNAKKATGPR